ncbi:hypothetical protein ER308_15090 [Egibacter rhizosphaerae]|uniref:Nucleotidyl transferase AbiEii/AbiGii toxin family protein n=1 Tax=Egibacter rhizosphaerae TaxID=1670831 RepID=A0A411YI12_9ACTN|nr:nucleotidyl transferase AbiEii/AbiGii toxin family protein [Egibacter rhizosphaerae]QBI20756.1 hypothetical protein ER308_15090 [Egibacter rhizosphaerae]
MITAPEAARWAERLGVTREQIERDHLVSHLLAALPRLDGPDAAFVGGTALARTHLDGLRVSEDIDLLVDDPHDYAPRLQSELGRLLRRAYPELEIGSAARAPRDLTLHLTANAVPSVEVQLLRREPAEQQLEYEQRAVSLRYHDLPTSVDWRVPTAESFVALKPRPFNRQPRTGACGQRPSRTLARSPP